jgi:hypothetical protein
MTWSRVTPDFAFNSTNTPVVVGAKVWLWARD